MKYLAPTVAITLIAILGSMAYFKQGREETFGERLNRIARKVNESNTTWKAHADGRFAHVTKEEIMRKLGAKLDMQNESEIEHLDTVEYKGPLGAAPASFDSRTVWPGCQSIQEIRDQSDCGSCWAFASVETMSDRICIASNQKDQTRISSTDLLSCCSYCGDGCQGGYPNMAFQYWKNNGIVTGDLIGDNSWCKPYPFKCNAPGYPACPAQEYKTPACEKSCNPEYTAHPYNGDKHFASKVYSAAGATNIANEISTNGPVATAFTVYEDFYSYKSGIYQHTWGGPLGGHAVKFVGYGSENGTDYWIVANSWDVTWGEQGFFRIVRGINNCGIENKVYGGFPKTN